MSERMRLGAPRFFSAWQLSWLCLTVYQGVCIYVFPQTWRAVGIICFWEVKQVCGYARSQHVCSESFCFHACLAECWPVETP